MSKNRLTVWYEKGVKFKCTQCGLCCGKEPGYVWLSEEDISLLSSHLQLSREDFLQKYTRFVYGRYSLLEMPLTYDCIFLKENKCSVYLARPKQCRKFPFWDENLTSETAWNQAGEYCEGINHEEGRLFSKEEIDHEILSP